ncbi:MAG: glycosyltransferase family 2 protein, partial [Nitriliruptor sp.]
MPEVSIVVPARDVAAYVGDLLGDLRAQRFTDMEVLLVDDRSSDGTREVLERHAQADARFRLLDGAGTGPSDARNLALDHAEGELLAFVDADDRVSPGYLATMHAAMRDSGSEVVVANARRLYGGRTRASRLHLRACARPGRGLTLDERPELVYDVTVWNKLIRRELWESDGLRFAPGRWINDVYPSLRTHVLARRIDVLDEVLYHWRERSAGDSITASKFHDAAARQKSLADRAHAIASTRTMLAEAQVSDGVRARFDERLLLHDLWTYLPLYHEGDRRYRRELAALIEDVLAGLFTTLDDHPLGPVLATVYGAIRDGDHDTLPQLLAPDTRVVATARDGAIHHRLVPGTPPSRGALARVRSRQVAPVEPVVGVAEHLTVEARLEGVRLHPGRPPRLTVTGRLRLRDGASDLHGPWQATLWLTANGTRTRTRRASAELSALPAPDAHALRRSGWRAFTLDLALGDLAANADLERWTVQVGVQLDGVHHRA